MAALLRQVVRAPRRPDTGRRGNWRVTYLRMTNAQFDALAQLVRLRTGAQQDAARLVLVDGMRQVDAARQLGISTAALGATMRACRRGVALAEIICGAPRKPLDT